MLKIKGQNVRSSSQVDRKSEPFVQIQSQMYNLQNAILTLGANCRCSSGPRSTRSRGSGSCCRWRTRWHRRTTSAAGTASSTRPWSSSPASTSVWASSGTSSTGTRWRAALHSTSLWMNCEFTLYHTSPDGFIHSFSLAILVKIMMSLAIFFSYALQFYVPVELLNPFIQRR